MDAWTVIGLVVFAGVALLFLTDALTQPTLFEKLAALVFIVLGVAFAIDLADPWLPLALLVGGLGLWFAGRRERDSMVGPGTRSAA